MRAKLARYITVSLFQFVSVPALAAQIPPSALQPLEPGMPLLTIRVDVRNMVGPDNAGKIDSAQMKSRVDAANDVWSQCNVRFLPRATENIDSKALGLPYSPKSENDLSKIASTLNPDGNFHGAIPLTFAGPWGFYDAGSGLYLIGLGWVFADAPAGGSPKISRIGAMIDNRRLFVPMTGPIIAHELGHALSLQHVREVKNLMGPGGTPDLDMDQCRQARGFAEAALRDFMPF